MESHSSNPAGRLWLYFDHLRTQNPKVPVQRLAIAYFGAEGVDARFMTGIAELMRLPDEAEALVNQTQSVFPLPKLIRPLPKVREYLTADPLGTNPAAWVQNYIDSGVLSDLETTSHVLGGHLGAGTDIEDSTLKSIKTLAEEIVALALADEELDEEARAAIIRYAHRIVSATALYKVVGPQGLIDELDRFYSEHRRIKPTPSRPLTEKLGQLIGAVVIAVELFGAPATISNAIEYYGDTFELSESVHAPAPSEGHAVAVAEQESGTDVT